MKVSLVAGGMVRPDGLTEIETMVAFVTSSVVEPLMESSVAEMVVVPGTRPLTRPPRWIAATVVSDEVQDTFPVTLRVLPSVKVPIA